jgi:hypothetical protein
VHSTALLTHLELGGLCDDCLSELAGITPRQTVNALCRRLANSNRVTRERGECKHCGRIKLVKGECGQGPVNPSSVDRSDLVSRPT